MNSCHGPHRRGVPFDHVYWGPRIRRAGRLADEPRISRVARSPPTRGEEGELSENTERIRAFCAAWSRLDPVELAGYFAEDGVYHNMPTGPVKGRAEIEGFIRSFIASWTKTDWEIVTLAEAGDVVIAERIDRTEAGDKSVDLPCTGVFTLRDGEIASWRDYFDLGTYARAMQ